MHDIEPYSNWLKYYSSSNDERSPFFGKTYNYNQYSDTIYGYYIDPAWDFIGSETLYVKILFADYEVGFAILELFGEWNDAINNDIMHLKRNVIDELYAAGINKYILLGENVFNFHGSDDAYYEEWFEEVEDSEKNASGWVAAVSFPDFVLEEMTRFHIDRYVNFGGTLQVPNWRTMHPRNFFSMISTLVTYRIGM